MGEVPGPRPEQEPKSELETWMEKLRAEIKGYPEKTESQRFYKKWVETELPQWAEKLRAEIEEIIDDLLILADPKEGFSVINLLEGIGDRRTWGELHPDERTTLWYLIKDCQSQGLLEGIVVEREKDDQGNYIDIRFRKVEEEKSAETIRLTFSGECVCGNVVTLEAKVPKEPTPKIKKDKKTGKRYRDWDYPEPIRCGKCKSEYPGEDGSYDRFVQVYFREWLD